MLGKTQIYTVAPACSGWNGCNGKCLAFVFHILAQNTDIYRCICSNHDKLDLYLETLIFGGTDFWGSGLPGAGFRIAMGAGFQIQRPHRK